jgi:hypothetical protein
MVSGKCFPWFFMFICHHLWYNNKHGLWTAKLLKNAITLSLPTDRVKHNSSVVMQCRLHIISASLQCKLQPHHRLSWSAVLPISAYPIIEDVNWWQSQLLHCMCWENNCEHTLATHLLQSRTEALLIVLNSHQYQLF